MKTRRLVLTTSVAAAAAVAGIAVGVRPPLPSGYRRRVQRAIYEAVPNINFDGHDLSIVADYALAKFIPGGEATAARSDPSDARFGDDTNRAILGLFFLCTNYFDPGRRPGVRVVVVRSPDPYEAGCSNPLAVFEL